MTVNPTDDLLDFSGKTYTVTLAAGAVRDTANNNHAGITGASYAFSVSDATPPLAQTFVPAQGADGVLKSANIVLTFNENVQAGTGTIDIVPSEGSGIASTLKLDVTTGTTYIPPPGGRRLLTDHPMHPASRRLLSSPAPPPATNLGQPASYNTAKTASVTNTIGQIADPSRSHPTELAFQIQAQNNLVLSGSPSPSPRNVKAYFPYAMFQRTANTGVTMTFSISETDKTPSQSNLYKYIFTITTTTGTFNTGDNILGATSAATAKVLAVTSPTSMVVNTDYCISTESSLSALVIFEDANSILSLNPSPSFATPTISYTLTAVKNGIDKLYFKPTATDSQATLTVGGSNVASGDVGMVSLAVGVNTINIVVTAEDSSTTTYTVTVTRDASVNTDAGLAQLLLSRGVHLAPTFSYLALAYYITVPSGVDNVAFTPRADSAASITVAGDAVTSGASKTVTLPGDGATTTVLVAVTAGDTTTTKTYQVHVTRSANSNSDASLRQLSISAGTLSPAFIPNTVLYFVMVANGVSSVQITPEAAQTSATITVAGAAVTSGSASTNQNLNEGSNTITIVVTAGNGVVTRTYNIIVTRILIPVSQACASGTKFQANEVINVKGGGTAAGTYVSQERANASPEQTHTVTVAASKFVVDGTSQKTLTLVAGNTYTFNLDDASNAGANPFALSTTNDGSHASGVALTSGVTFKLDGVAISGISDWNTGFQAATTRRLTITPAASGTLYYYNTGAASWGGTISVVAADADTSARLTQRSLTAIENKRVTLNSGTSDIYRVKVAQAEIDSSGHVVFGASPTTNAAHRMKMIVDVTSVSTCANSELYYIDDTQAVSASTYTHTITITTTSGTFATNDVIVGATTFAKATVVTAPSATALTVSTWSPTFLFQANEVIYTAGGSGAAGTYVSTSAVSASHAVADTAVLRQFSPKATGTSIATNSDGSQQCEFQAPHLSNLVMISAGLQLSISGQTMTISPLYDLKDHSNTLYSVVMASGVIKDTGNRAFAGLGATDYQFRTQDTSVPIVSIYSPAQGSSAQSKSANVVLTFSENVIAGTGSITLTPTGGNGANTPLTIPISDAQVSIADEIVTVNPSADLDDRGAKTWGVTMPSGILKDKFPAMPLEYRSSVVQLDSDTTLIATFSEAIASGTATIADFEIKVDGSSVTPSNIASTSGTTTNPGTVTFTLPSSVSIGQSVTLAYTKSGTAGQNLASTGGALASFTARPAVVSYLYMVSALVEQATPTTLVVSMNAAIDTGTATIADFRITVAGASVTPTNIASTSGTATNPGTITFTLPSPVTAGQSVRIGHTKSSTAAQVLEIATGALESTPVGGEITSANTVCPNVACPNVFGGIGAAVYSYQIADSTSPTGITTFNPADGATGINKNTNIVLTFNEHVRITPATSNVFTLTSSGGSGANPVVYIPALDAQVSVLNDAVTINPSADLIDNTNKVWSLSFPTGTIQDPAGNMFGALADGVYSFTLDDSTPPVLLSRSPIAGATGIVKTSNIVLTFNENVQAGTGNIVITDISTGIQAHTTAMPTRNIAVGDGQVVASGLVVTLNPTTDLVDLGGRIYTIAVPAGAFKDTANLNMVADTFNFTVADTTAPAITTYLPAQGATGIAKASVITLTFDENVQAGTGNILLTPSGGTGGNPVVTIPISSSMVTVNNLVVTITPAEGFIPVDHSDKTLTVTAVAGVIKDATNNDFTLSGSTYAYTLNDQTPPEIATYSPLQAASEVSAASDILLTFSENVAKGTGNVVITPTGVSGTNTVLTIAISDAQVSISNTVVTINPTNNLDDRGAKMYTVTIPSTGFKDTKNFDFKGIEDSTLGISFAVVDLLQSQFLKLYMTGAIATGIATISDFVITVAGSTVTPTVIQSTSTTAATPGIVTFTLPSPVTSAQAVTVQYTKSGTASQNLASTSGALASFGPIAADVSYLYITGAQVNNDAPSTLIVYVNKAIASGIATLTDFVITLNGSPITPSGITSTSGTATNPGEIRFTLASKVTTGQAITVKYVKAGNPSQQLISINGPMSSTKVAIAARNFVLASTTYQFNVKDTTAPTLQSNSPVNGATGISKDTTLTLTYDENVKKGSGYIIITPSGGNQANVPVSISVLSALVVISGPQITITPPASLDDRGQKVHSVTFATGVFKDTEDNDVPAITTGFSFTVPDVSPPVISVYSPNQGATGVANSADVVVTFNEDVVLTTTASVVLTPDCTGIVTCNGANTALTIPLNDALQVRLTSSKILTINPTYDLDDKGTKRWTLTMPAASVKDTTNHDFAGLSSPTFQFVVADSTPPTIVSYAPAFSAAYTHPKDGNIQITFSENVVVGSGTIILTPTGGFGDNSLFRKTIPCSSDQFTAMNDKATINPSQDLEDDGNKLYTVYAPAGFVTDAVGLPVEGILGIQNTYHFGVADSSKPLMTGTDPVNQATGILKDTNIVITFSEIVKQGTGKIVLQPSGGSGALVNIEIQVTDTSQVSFGQTAVGNTLVEISAAVNLGSPSSLVLTLSDAIASGTATIADFEVKMAGTLLIGTDYGTSANAKWWGGVLAGNGRIYAIPDGMTQVLKIDPTDDSTTLIGDTYAGTAKYLGGMLATNGKIYACPKKAAQVLKIDPTDDTTSLVGTDYGTTVWKWADGAMAYTGMLYCAPYNKDQVLKINPTDDTTSLVGTTYSGGDAAWVGATLATNGMIYMVPAKSAAKVLKLNPVDDTTSLVGSSYGDGTKLKWFGSVLARNGMIYAIPYESDQVLKINTADDTTSLVGSTFATGEKWAGGVLNDDGIIYGIPSGTAAGGVLKINPGDASSAPDTWIEASTTTGFRGGVLASNKMIYGIPHATTQAKVLRNTPAILGSAITPTNIASTSGTATNPGTVTLTLPSAVTLGQSLTIAYTMSAVASRNLASSTGKLPSFTSKNVVVSHLMMVSAAVANASPSTLTVTMNAAIASGTATVADFTVKVAGSSTTHAPTSISTSSAATNPGVVTLTLPTPVTAGQAVSVAYTKSSTVSQHIASSAGTLETTPVGAEVLALNSVCYTANCIMGTTVTINPTTILDDCGDKLYTVHFIAGVIKDVNNNDFNGLPHFPAQYQFRLTDTTPPLLNTLSPVDGATGIQPSTNLVLTFNENVQAGSGNIIITPSGGNTNYNGATYTNSQVIIDVRDGTQVTFMNEVCTINPAVDLVDFHGKTHTVTFAAGVITDIGGFGYLGISGTNFDFTVVDVSVPHITTLLPIAGAQNIAIDTTITLTFSEDIQAGTGNFVLTPTTGSAQTYAAGSAQVSVSNAVLTVTPSANLAYDTQYTVTMDAGFVKDQSNAPSPVSAAALAGTTYQFKVTTYLRLIFSQDITAGTGFFRIYTVSSNVGTEIPINDANRISISGNILTIVPIGVPSDTEYYIQMYKGVIKDTSGRIFAGASFHFPYASGDHYIQFRYG